MYACWSKRLTRGGVRHLAKSPLHERITFHDLRHSYATDGLKAGVSPRVVSDRIGHANVGFFLQTYAHVLVDDGREAAQQAAAFPIGDRWAKQPPEQDDELA